MRSLLFSAALLLAFSASSQVTPIYINLNCHTEETDFEGIGGNSSGMENPTYGYNNDSLKYASYRNYVRQVADTVILKNVKWDFQSDWTFIEGAMNFDHGSLVANTSGLDIINYLQNNTGGRVCIDPHAHATSHNMADIAWMLTQMGVTPTNVVGGFLYDTLSGSLPGNDWRTLRYGIQTVYYPYSSTGYTWTPDVLWGGGSSNHTHDLNDYGAWKPVYMDFVLPADSIYTHDPSQPILLIGNGCTGKIPDVALSQSQAMQQVNAMMSTLTNLATNIASGNYTQGKFYTATIQFDVRNLGNPYFLFKIGKIIDAINAYNTSNPGTFIWQTAPEKRNTWNNSYSQISNQRDCSGNVITAPAPPSGSGIDEHLAENISIYPNPASSSFSVSGIPAGENISVHLYDASGREISASSSASDSILDIQLPFIPNGIYLIRISGNEGNLIATKRLTVIN